ncbi:cation:proton antiporter [Sulfurospirillum barnesii]|uniref:Kef-type K+ transport system, membrane component n=1 Tax=Sulfurospirillum barnesii (strain ATCC 700032 / DSM 10660 / SES-3) TaxID=760154 RepID=I3XX19_SULBS|nr:cation:proton antiporter [Sulfurospirillum barnesii]AFL68493.1 Kef-type K+ transport system, membrane component [Sulfurospirillum barnesii SES-3]
MQIHEFFLSLFLILIVARFLSELFAKYGIPSVLGELLAGVLLGSSVFGLITPNEVLKILAEIGIILLLFEVGLETDFHRLKDAGMKSFTVAILGVVLPFICGFLLAYYLFNLSFDISLFIGGTLTATSIGITLRVLKDIHMEQTNIAQIVIGAAVIDDIIGIILLVFIYDFSIAQEVSFQHTLSVTTMVVSFLILAPILAKVLSFLIHKFHAKMLVPGYIPTIIISLILIFSYFSHMVGAPAILGSFAAGVALSRRFFLPFGTALGTNEQLLNDVKVNMTPIIQIFTPIFFVMVGLSLNLRVIDFSSGTFWIMSLSFIFLAFLTKFAGAFFIFQKSIRNNALIGVSMIPRGEVGLIFAEMGRINGVLPNEIYAMLIFVIVITTVIPPFILKHYFKAECV